MWKVPSIDVCSFSCACVELHSLHPTLHGVKCRWRQTDVPLPPQGCLTKGPLPRLVADDQKQFDVLLYVAVRDDSRFPMWQLVMLMDLLPSHTHDIKKSVNSTLEAMNTTLLFVSPTLFDIKLPP